MFSQQPLVWRITIAFLLMTFVVSGVFSLSIVAIVHFIEEEVVSENLDLELNSIIFDKNRNQANIDLGDNLHFYSTDTMQNLVPKQFIDLPEGFSEIIEGSDAYYVYVRHTNGHRYFLVQDQNEIEAHEQALFTAVLMAFIVSILGALCLGWLIARRVIAPVTRLAEQVQHRDQLHSLAPPLANEYANDEVGHLATAFDATLNRLKQSLEREQLFTSDVSHELRTPLMVIATSCELLQESSMNKLQHSQVERITRTTNEMKDLVQTFLMLARSPSEATTIGGKASLREIAQAQGEQWGNMIKAKDIQFNVINETEKTGNELYNHAFLMTVMANLLRNALHYTEQGKIQLVLTTHGFKVEDSGIGIPSEQQANIFEPFTRGPQARGEGLGLGLSLVKRICEHQGWQINVTPSSIGGSCFQVILNSPS